MRTQLSVLIAACALAVPLFSLASVSHSGGNSGSAASGAAAGSVHVAGTHAAAAHGTGLRGPAGEASERGFTELGPAARSARLAERIPVMSVSTSAHQMHHRPRMRSEHRGCVAYGYPCLTIPEPFCVDSIPDKGGPTDRLDCVHPLKAAVDR